jgi:hypothetical protein
MIDWYKRISNDLCRYYIIYPSIVNYVLLLSYIDSHCETMSLDNRL